MPHASDETLDTPAPQVRNIVFAVAPELVLLDACGPLEAFHRAELTVRDARRVSTTLGERVEPVAYRTTVASIDGDLYKVTAQGTTALKSGAMPALAKACHGPGGTRKGPAAPTPSMSPVSS